MIRIFGTMTDPSGSPVPGAIIELRSISSTSEVLLGSTVNHKCDQQGAYSFQLAAGMYDAYAQNDRCGDMDYLGTAKVSANSADGDLHSILVDGGINITPPMLDSALAAAQRAESAADMTAADRVITSQNAESAKTDSASAKTAKDGAVSAASTAVSAKDSIVSDAKDVRSLATQVANQATDVSAKHGDVVAKAAQVSGQADMVSAKHAEVITKAQQVSGDAAATQSAKSISVAAADTATQKAASAAIHDASAQDAATRAENAASAVVGAVLDGGECDLSTGAYPQPITVAGKKYSTIWYVAVAGSVSGVAFDVGDLLRYTTAKTGYYFKVDAKDEVYSVNGEKGAVQVTPAKIGAEVAGVAQSLVTQHEAKNGAHSIAGVSELQGALDAKLNANLVSSFGKTLIDDADAPTARATLGLGTSATRNTGNDAGQLLPLGSESLNKVVTGALVPSTLVAGQQFQQNGAGGDTSTQMGIGYCVGTSMRYSGAPIYAVCMFGNLGAGYILHNALAAEQGGIWRQAKFRDDRNTTVDANGFIKNASPIVRVGAVDIQTSGDEPCGHGVCNSEAVGVTVERIKTGVYKVTGSNGFAKEGWYIETPHDANGNKLLHVRYNQNADGSVDIFTSTPDYSSGKCDAGEPADIPVGRWIDIRLDMPDVV
ncbi:prophage tail fiber N-terminal domain-containing protein [Aeromonas jandaei]|uniref:Prophage tail fiber N-terminal domain-containing protein n=1 Tax=Aeromonas jandaei TaxID=650 RepID=A0A7T4DNN5_AERJA|nr:prophage tail fiber N-terminal domain-containing protein [Aeromonas jandaei]QQB19343.1 prophage tail fiber N-terminal domain-containing protein [Aeromonas jandaei]UCA34018.1 prophage tail fiber N-terminal domain-containing protein [Aeromonas jandaei]